jgi:hypothetical protein
MMATLVDVAAPRQVRALTAEGVEVAQQPSTKAWEVVQVTTQEVQLEESSQALQQAAVALQLEEARRWAVAVVVRQTSTHPGVGTAGQLEALQLVEVADPLVVADHSSTAVEEEEQQTSTHPGVVTVGQLEALQLVEVAVALQQVEVADQLVVAAHSSTAVEEE